MIIIHDHATAVRALSEPLSPAIRAALEREIALLTSGEHDFTRDTAILVVQSGDTATDIARETGLPLSLDGWDVLTSRDGVHRMIVTYGSTFATILLIPDDADPALLALFR